MGLNNAMALKLMDAYGRGDLRGGSALTLGALRMRGGRRQSRTVASFVAGRWAQRRSDAIHKTSPGRFSEPAWL